MLNSNDWWGMIRDYHKTVFPMQLILMAIGIVLCVYLLFGDKEKGSIFAKVYLALSNLWIGIGFFILLGTELPAPMRISQGTLFILIGLMFVVDIFTMKSTIAIPKSGTMRTLTIILLIIVMIYPTVGLIQGKDIYSMLFIGLLPCPTTALALVLLCASMPEVNKWIFIPLLFWAIPFPPFIQIPKYHVYEDSILFAMGIYTIIYLVIYFVKGLKSKKDA